MAGDGVELFRGEDGVVEAGGRRSGAALIDTALDPELSGAAVLPVGEDGDAVAGTHDVGEVVLEFAEGQVPVDDLRHFEARLQGEGEMSDDAERAEADDGSGDAVAVLIAGEGVDGAICRDEFDGGDGGGEVSIAHAGAVGGGGNRASDGD